MNGNPEDFTAPEGIAPVDSPADVPVSRNPPLSTDDRVPELPTLPRLEPPSDASLSSDRLGALIDAGLKIEIDRQEQERLARRGPVAGAD